MVLPTIFFPSELNFLQMNFLIFILMLISYSYRNNLIPFLIIKLWWVELKFRKMIHLNSFDILILGKRKTICDFFPFIYIFRYFSVYPSGYLTNWIFFAFVNKAINIVIVSINVKLKIGIINIEWTNFELNIN